MTGRVGSKVQLRTLRRTDGAKDGQHCHDVATIVLTPTGPVLAFLPHLILDFLAEHCIYTDLPGFSPFDIYSHDLWLFLELQLLLTHT